MSDATRVVLCWAKAKLKRPAEGAWVDWCHRCKVEIWVAPTTRAFQEQQDVLLVCMDCGEQEYKADPKPQWGLMPGQGNEVVREILRRRAERDEPPVTGL